MKSVFRNPLAMIVGLSLAGYASAFTVTPAAGAAVPSVTTIEGLVRDIACPLQNKQATATSFNLQCAVQCARRGSPLAILAPDGTLYMPISSAMPDHSQRRLLMPFVGKYVQVRGQVLERAGMRAIIVQQIKEVKGKHLVTNAQ